MNTLRMAAQLRADGDFRYYRPAAMLVALVLLLVWQGVAQAAEYVPPDRTQLPDAVHGQGADRIPPGLACTDNMDFSPEDNLPSPFDADSIAYHPRPAGLFALRASTDGRCPGSMPKVNKI